MDIAGGGRWLGFGRGLIEALSIRIESRGARELSPKANNFTGLVTYIVYDKLRWRLHHILHLSTPNVLISFRTGMGARDTQTNPIPQRAHLRQSKGQGF